MWMIMLYSAIVLFIYVLIACIVGTIKKNNGIMDIFYGPGYFVVAIVSFVLSYLESGVLSIRKIIVTSLVFLWAVRLAIYVFIRNRGKPEDKRYANMRERWKEAGKNVFFKSLTKIYLFQGLVIFIVVFPVLWINVSPAQPLEGFLSIGFITLVLGGLLWIFGFYFESVGDYQLYRFLNNPNRTKEVMDKGLWKYTQHPNYFGEVTMWWSIYIIAIGVPWGFIMIFSPIYITVQIIKVSGVKLLNKRFEGDDAYADYKRRTSSFFPWFPKKRKSQKK
ncbi:MAG: DUF1295 domain-containing protein [Candidatus Lokiarchaeota archaeon]|nr:DUF1295 domain-containing protein [Candidatus Lokiarchaeota archaeon]MBD3339451.1 DUF1295 domain-containing protein [Candidatus Lokiarchaeota archaeon]